MMYELLVIAVLLTVASASLAGSQSYDALVYKPAPVNKPAPSYQEPKYEEPKP